MTRLTLLALLLASPALAQTAPPANVTMLNGQPRSVVPGASMCWDAPSALWTACAATGGAVRESFALVVANVPSAQATVYGGDYILSQTCTSYGTLALQVLGPDGATWQTVVSKTASDAGAGTGLSIGSFAKVRVTVTGTAGCNALLARVPA
jgi:hypothetical protein